MKVDAIYAENTTYDLSDIFTIGAAGARRPAAASISLGRDVKIRVQSGSGRKILLVSTERSGGYAATLSDCQGRVIESKAWNGSQTVGLAAARKTTGVYLLRIRNASATFNIIKAIIF